MSSFCSWAEDAIRAAESDAARMVVESSPMTSLARVVSSMPASTTSAPCSEAPTAALVALRISPSRARTWAVACFDCSASRRTSWATTLKPFPCSPARAASMAAFRASRLD